jgi:hypothetical protein
MVPAFNDWCFDEAREPGHSGIVKTEYGYHVMYFVSWVQVWERYAQQDLIAEKSGTMMDTITAEFPMEVSYGDVALGYVNLAG